MTKLQRIAANGGPLSIQKVDDWKPKAKVIDPGALGENKLAKKAPLHGKRFRLLSTLVAQKREQDSLHQQNNYYIERGLLEYCNMFTPNTDAAKIDLEAICGRYTKNFREMYYAAPSEKTNLFQDLQARGKDCVWLDAGAGYARAQREFRAAGGQATLVANSMQRPSVDQESYHVHEEADRELSAFEEQDNNFRYVEGRIQLPHIREKIGKVDVITDMIGAFSYSHPSMTLQAYADLLKPGGSLYLHVPKERIVIEDEGRQMSLAEWAASLPGFELKSVYEIKPLSRSMTQSLVLTRTDEEAVIPPLYLDKMNSDSMPPIRTFVSAP